MKKLLFLGILAISLVANKNALADDNAQCMIVDSNNNPSYGSLLYDDKKANNDICAVKLKDADSVLGTYYHVMFNNRLITEHYAGALKFYNTSKKNIKVMSLQSEDGDRTWDFFNVDNGQTLSLAQNGDNLYIYEIRSGQDSHSQLVDGDMQLISKSESGACNDDKVKSALTATKVNPAPVFSGFYVQMASIPVNAKAAYIPKNKNSELNCKFSCSEGSNCIVGLAPEDWHIPSGAPDGDIGQDRWLTAMVVNPTLNILGLSPNLNQVYFSATGKNWTAYYSYDRKTKKVAKISLAKINKDKLKLVMLKTL